MKKITGGRTAVLYLVCIMILTILLYAVFGHSYWTKYANQKSHSEFKVLFLASGPIADQSWDAKGFEGYLQIKKTFHVEGNYLQNVKEDQIQPYVIDYIQKGYNLIIGNGSEYGDKFKPLALKYPQVEFIALGGGINDVDNLACPYFQSYPLGYFAGIIAALETKSNQVGLIMPHDNMNEQRGFEDAVKKYNPAAQVLKGIASSWNDNQKAMQIADDFVAKGVDVVFPLGDSFNFPVINKLKEHHIYSFGYIDDQNYVAKDTVLVSLLQHNDKLIVETVTRWAQGKHPSGKVPYTFRDGAESISTISPSVPAWIQHQVQQAIKDYLNGTLPIPDSVFD